MNQAHLDMAKMLDSISTSNWRIVILLSCPRQLYLHTDVAGGFHFWWNKFNIIQTKAGSELQAPSKVQAIL